MGYAQVHAIFPLCGIGGYFWLQRLTTVGQWCIEGFRTHDQAFVFFFRGISLGGLVYLGQARHSGSK